MTTKKKIKKPFVLLDSNALFHRCYHALPQTIRLRDGTLINAAYGFTSVLMKMIMELDPGYMVACFDLAEPTFRHIEYTEYKANREKAPDELYNQIPYVKDMLGAFEIPIFEVGGYEADDVIGTLAKLAKREVDDVLIVTGDRDAFQLVDKKVHVVIFQSGFKETLNFGPKEVLAKYQITPAQVVDFKALRGDPSDNIPGVRGVGEKTALHLLTEYRTLDGVYKNLKKIKESVRNKLEVDKKNAYLSYKLATIYCDVPLQFEVEMCHFGTVDFDRVRDLFGDLEFKTLLKRLDPLEKKYGTVNQESLF